MVFRMAPCDGVAQKFGSGFEHEFSSYIGAVCFHRFEGDAKQGCDFARGLALADAQEDFKFPV